MVRVEELTIEVRAVVDRAIADLRRTQKVVDEMEKQQGKYEDTTKKTEETVTKIFGGMSKGVSGFSNVLKGMGSSAVAGVGIALAALTGFFYWLSKTSPAIEAHTTSIGYAFEQVGFALGDFFEPMFAYLDEGVWAISDFVSEGIDNFTDAISKSGEDTALWVTKVSKQFNDWKEGLGASIDNAKTKITEWASGIWDSISGTLGTFWENIKSGFGGVWTKITEVFSFENIKNTIKSFVDSAWNALPKWLQDRISGVVEAPTTTTTPTTVTTGYTGGAGATTISPGGGATTVISTPAGFVTTPIDLGNLQNPFGGGPLPPSNISGVVGQAGGILSTVGNWIQTNILSKLGFQEGGMVSRTGMAFLHAGEMVVPRNEVNNYRNQTVNFMPTVYFGGGVQLGKDQWAMARNLTEQWHMDLKRWMK